MIFQKSTAPAAATSFLTTDYTDYTERVFSHKEQENVEKVR